MGRHPIKAEMWKRIKFLFIGERKIIIPRKPKPRYRLTKKGIEAVNKLTDKVAAQHQKLEPIK